MKYNELRQTHSDTATDSDDNNNNNGASLGHFNNPLPHCSTLHLKNFVSDVFQTGFSDDR